MGAGKMLLNIYLKKVLQFIFERLFPYRKLILNICLSKTKTKHEKYGNMELYANNSSESFY
jgi:hypothetical protein